MNFLRTPFHRTPWTTASGLFSCELSEKDTPAQVFLCEFLEILQNTLGRLLLIFFPVNQVKEIPAQGFPANVLRTTLDDCFCLFFYWANRNQVFSIATFERDEYYEFLQFENYSLLNTQESLL